MAARTWRYVTLDATGTLLRPVEPPGVTYLRFWEMASGQTFSSSHRTAAAAALASQFPTEFRLQSQRSPNFGSPGATAFPWWRELVLNVMKRANVVDCLSHSQQQSERFTNELYAHFAQPEAWKVFDDVRPTLEQLAALDLTMGVVSNFDERLEPLLVELQLREFFAVVTTSFNEKDMKPHASIFHKTFRQLQREEGDVDVNKFLHVGDHPVKDYRAAKTLGAQAKLLWRSETQLPPSDVQEKEIITTLGQVINGTGRG